MGILFAFIALIFIRSSTENNKNIWSCINNQWVKVGNPKSPKPNKGCGNPEDNWQQEIFSEASLSLKIPNGMSYRKEIAEDVGKIRVASFYVEKSGNNNSFYMLYFVYQPGKKASQQDIELAKTEMDKTTIKEVAVGGFKGIEGLVTGPKTRYLTILLNNDKLYTISTIPPTKENKILTDQILTTFHFK